MARPCKPRQLEGIPRPAFYMPSGWTHEQVAPTAVAIEDFEILRLVDGHAFTIEDAAGKVGVSKSTAGRMLERARRNLALAIERQAPLYLDALESSVLAVPQKMDANSESHQAVLAIALRESDEESEVDRIFGRASAFAMVATSGKVHLVDNPGQGVARGAAVLAVECLQAHGVKRVAAGRFGPDALEALSRSKIEPLIVSGLRLRHAIELLK